MFLANFLLAHPLIRYIVFLSALKAISIMIGIVPENSKKTLTFGGLLIGCGFFTLEGAHLLSYFVNNMGKHFQTAGFFLGLIGMCIWIFYIFIWTRIHMTISLNKTAILARMMGPNYSQVIKIYLSDDIRSLLVIWGMWGPTWMSIGALLTLAESNAGMVFSLLIALITLVLTTALTFYGVIFVIKAVQQENKK